MPLTSKKFAPGAPNPKIAKFSLGTMKPDYDVKMQLVSKQRLQITHNAIESARVSINKKLGEIENEYHLLVKSYPHVILRENKMIATAGADRLQEGMRRAWGKPSSRAARVYDGAVLFEIQTYSKHLNLATDAMNSASSKLPAKVVISTVLSSTQKKN